MKEIRIVLLASLTTLALSGCGKFEQWTWVDNNCSGNSGIYWEERCAEYIAKP